MTGCGSLVLGMTSSVMCLEGFGLSYIEFLLALLTDARCRHLLILHDIWTQL